MKMYLGLGSNMGNRIHYLESAIQRIERATNARGVRVSRIYETPALLPPQADASWNKPFLNVAIEIESECSPLEILGHAKKIEAELGRQKRPRWALREIDIDLLCCGDMVINSPELQLPHPEMHKRAFVLDPLKDLAPRLHLPHEPEHSVLQLARRHPQHSPIWMAVINLTPDSFSDGGQFHNPETLLEELTVCDENHIGIVDIGGESTRPGAAALTPAEEWARIKDPLLKFHEKFRGRRLRPLISVDTRHFDVALKAVEVGVDMINDVSGLADPRYVNLIRDSSCLYILTHSLSIPADPQVTLAPSDDVVSVVRHWFEQKLAILLAAGSAPERIILDPGIGFGKTRLQSWTLLRSIAQFFALDFRVLVGHSRKSFLADISGSSAQDRDLESIGISMCLAESGVDILRVHNPVAHVRAFRGWNNARSAT